MYINTRLRWPYAVCMNNLVSRGRERVGYKLNTKPELVNQDTFSFIYNKDTRLCWLKTVNYIMSRATNVYTISFTLHGTLVD